MSSYPVLEGRPIDQWKVTELKEELKKRKLATRGLKEDLIKRLDEAIRIDAAQDDLLAQDDLPGQGDVSAQGHMTAQEDVPSDSGFDSAPQSEDLNEQPAAGVSDEPEKSITLDDNFVKHNVVANEEPNKDVELQVTYDQEKLDALVSENIQDVSSQAEHVTEKLDNENLSTGVVDDSASTKEEKVEEVNVVNSMVSAGSEADEFQVSGEKTTEIVAETKESVMHLGIADLQDGLTRDDSDLKSQFQNGDSGTLLVDSKVDISDPNNQVSEVNPTLGFQVKSDSIYTETVTINEKIELKDNIIADDVKIELDVKPEMVYPSSSNDVPDSGKSHPMDVEEPQANEVSVEETGGINAENEDLSKEIDTGDLGSSENLNLDRSSGDDFMEEGEMEAKPESRPDSDEVSFKEKEVEASDAKEEGLVDIVGEEDMADEVKVVAVEEKDSAAPSSAKRKPDDHQVLWNSDTTKRQRRWNTEGLKVSEQRSVDVSITPKGASPALKRSFSGSGSSVSEEAPKERVVPPSSKPPTTSLRIDRFLRPFTLKAVQELLEKTGTVTEFWMDRIKTHCYVTYSSVEEAVETRNAVYNLQWPTNGGRLLVAEFVDPQEVKARLAPPPQIPAAAPVGAGASVSASNPPGSHPVPPLPSPRLQVQKQQQQQPQQPAFLPPPPPPPSATPAPAREHQAPVKERLALPPPPPLPEKADPPVVTLDDLFRKTKATPRIYYLPLSEEEVAAKLQAQRKTVKQ